MEPQSLLGALRTRLYPTLGVLLVTPAVMAESADSGGGAKYNYERTDVACFARELFAECPEPGAVTLTNADVDPLEDPSSESCAPKSVDALAEKTVRQCCYTVTLSCEQIVGCGCGGRPLRIEHRVVRSPLTLGSRVRRANQGWALPAELDGTRRACLGAWWGSIGAAESASVTSFRHFQHALRALDAPVVLQARAAQAAREEARHGRVALRLAGRYLGATVKAGPVEIPAYKPDLLGFAFQTARDGAAEELRSLWVLAGALEGARDPAVRASLAGIVKDELSHVDLAWASLAWVRARAGRAGREAIRAGLAEPEPATAAWPLDAQLAEHGLLDGGGIRRAFGFAAAVNQAIEVGLT